MGKQSRAKRRAAPPTVAAPAKPSRFVLDGPRDWALIVAAPLWVVPLLLGAGGLFGDRATNTAVMALGATGHHLPGMLRAYGDRALFRRFRARFLLAPVAFGAACVFFAARDLHALVYVAFGWGVWHGMMQTYGFARIYAGKAGFREAWSARLDFALLAAWFASGVLFSPQRLAFLLEGVAEFGAPLPSPSVVAAIRWLAAAATALATVAWFVRCARTWRAGRRPDALHVALLAGSIAFWWYANVRVTHPLLGMPLFELFHDAQYLAIVWAFNRRRADAAPGELAPALAAISRPHAAAVLLYLVAVVAYGALALPRLDGELGAVAGGLVAASQLLHFYYDGFIWKVREPQTAQALGVATDGKSPAPPVRRFHALGWGLLAAASALLAFGESRGLAARERLPLVADLVPDNTLVGFAAAELRWQAGDRARALDGFRRVVALDPSYAPARDNLAISLEELIDAAARTGNENQLAPLLDELAALRPRLGGDVAALADKQLAGYAGARSPSRPDGTP